MTDRFLIDDGAFLEALLSRRDSDDGEDADRGHGEDEGDGLVDSVGKADVLFDDRRNALVDLSNAGLDVAHDAFPSGKGRPKPLRLAKSFASALFFAAVETDASVI